MSNVALSKTEAKILTEATGREGGLLQLPESMKDVTRQRLLGKLETAGLIVAAGPQGDDPVLTPAGYRAVGQKPPRGKRKAETIAGAEPVAVVSTRPGTKQELIVSLLGRPEGASLDELIAATGWLPHTTRAALSRLRSAGRELVKSPREDGRTAYSIAAPEPEPKPRSRAARKAAAPAEAAAA
ncbi:DUF3489 domain-containing protein [uncultured Enterovirga sp.]|uniref:DUF3489 domain-containing protein n=1 Tax=uncultured Enterovirga sp. TaxID=2026352 RepID=UPI0035CA8ED5